MPNESNIGSPISLVAHGRSGTSLLFRAFGKLADVDCVGETANMIFTTWRALDQIAGITRYGVIPNPHYKQDAARLVRNAFLQIFPSEKKDYGCRSRSEFRGSGGIFPIRERSRSPSSTGIGT